MASCIPVCWPRSWKTCGASSASVEGLPRKCGFRNRSLSSITACVLSFWVTDRAQKQKAYSSCKSVSCLNISTWGRSWNHLPSSDLLKLTLAPHLGGLNILLVSRTPEAQRRNNRGCCNLSLLCSFLEQSCFFSSLLAFVLKNFPFSCTPDLGFVCGKWYIFLCSHNIASALLFSLLLSSAVEVSC